MNYDAIDYSKSNSTEENLLQRLMQVSLLAMRVNIMCATEVRKISYLSRSYTSSSKSWNIIIGDESAKSYFNWQDAEWWNVFRNSTEQLEQLESILAHYAVNVRN